MLSRRLEITVDLNPSWPKERIGDFYKILTTRLTLLGNEALQQLNNLGFASVWLASERSTLRAYDKQFDVDLSCSFGEKPAVETDLGEPALSGVRVRRHASNLSVIPLPPQLWQAFEPRSRLCGCPWCAGGRPYFDTLVVSTMGRLNDATSWLLHAPRFQRRVDRLRITVNDVPNIKTEALPELYEAVVATHWRKPAGTANLGSVGFYASWGRGVGSLWSGANDDPGKGVFLKVLPNGSPPDGASPYQLNELHCTHHKEMTAIWLPSSLWRPADKTLLNCSCGKCLLEPPMLNALCLRIHAPYQPSIDVADIAELMHIPEAH